MISLNSTCIDNFNFNKLNYQDHIVVDKKYKLNARDFQMFGDRVLSGFEKIRLISKKNNTANWLYKKIKTIKDEKDQYYIIK